MIINVMLPSSSRGMEGGNTRSKDIQGDCLGCVYIPGGAKGKAPHLYNQLQMRCRGAITTKVAEVSRR